MCVIVLVGTNIDPDIPSVLHFLMFVIVLVGTNWDPDNPNVLHFIMFVIVLVGTNWEPDIPDVLHAKGSRTYYDRGTTILDFKIFINNVIFVL